MPMFAPAPGRFSINTGCLQNSDKAGPRCLATTSFEPPGGNGTTRRTGWEGQPGGPRDHTFRAAGGKRYERAQGRGGPGRTLRERDPANRRERGCQCENTTSGDGHAKHSGKSVAAHLSGPGATGEWDVYDD